MSRLLDTFGDRYSKAILAVTALTMVVGPVAFGWPLMGRGGAMYRAFAFLSAAAPCALLMAPLVYVAAVGACARRGVLVRGGVTFDTLAECGVVALDKTGTITTGRMMCSSVERAYLETRSPRSWVRRTPTRTPPRRRISPRDRPRTRWRRHRRNPTALAIAASPSAARRIPSRARRWTRRRPRRRPVPPRSSLSAISRWCTGTAWRVSCDRARVRESSARRGARGSEAWRGVRDRGDAAERATPFDERPPSRPTEAETSPPPSSSKTSTFPSPPPTSFVTPSPTCGAIRKIWQQSLRFADSPHPKAAAAVSTLREGAWRGGEGMRLLMLTGDNPEARRNDRARALANLALEDPER